MRILAVNWQDLENPQAGGAEIHLFELLNRLAAKGHEVRLVCSGWPGGAKTAMIGGITVTRVGGRHSFAIRARSAVRAAIHQFQPQIIIEDINKLPLYLPMITNLPVHVIVPHLFGTTAFHEAAWPLAALVVAAEWPLARVYRGSSFHAISESTRDDLVARGIGRELISVAHPGVDTGYYTPSQAVPRSNTPSFLYIGRLKRYKGVDLAIRALALARRRRNDLSLDIAGTGDDRKRLETLAARLGVGEWVKFHGYVPTEIKLQMLRSTWANLFPSPKEGWGITVMEAAACGTPSIASDSPGLRDSVRPGVTGLLVPHGDVEELAGAMLTLATDPTKVAALGKAARSYALEHDWEHAVGVLERDLERYAVA